MSSVVISGDTSGAITLAAPAISGTNTATLPAATGTVMVSGNMPAFSAYMSTGQSVGTSANTKITFDTEEFDTNNNFASNRFTPTVAGYYQLNAAVSWSAGYTGITAVYIFKNGSTYKTGALYNSVSLQLQSVSSLVYANGSTDFFEIYVIQTSGLSQTTTGNIYSTWFNGSMVRSA